MDPGGMSQGYFSPLTQAPTSQMTHFLHLLPITLQLAQTNCDKAPPESTWQWQLPKAKRGSRKRPPEPNAQPRCPQGAGAAPHHALCHPHMVPPHTAPGQEQHEPSTAQHGAARRSTAWHSTAQPQCSQRSWSSSQWDTAGKDKRKSSKNKAHTTQCPMPLKTGAASERRPR